MRATKIKAEYLGTDDPDADLSNKHEYIFHMVEAGNNIVLFPCYEGEVLRYDNIHSFLEEWRLISKL